MGGRWTAVQRTVLVGLLGLSALSLPVGGVGSIAAASDFEAPASIWRLGAASATDLGAAVLVGLALVIAGTSGAIRHPDSRWRAALATLAVGSTVCALVLVVGAIDVGGSRTFALADDGPGLAARWSLVARFALGAALCGGGAVVAVRALVARPMIGADDG